MGCCISQLEAKFAFFPTTPSTNQLKKVIVSTTSSMPISGAVDDVNLDELLVDTKRGKKIVAFYLKNPHTKLTVIYSRGNVTDLGQLYDPRKTIQLHHGESTYVGKLYQRQINI
ncbi:hypothetical protein FXO38_08606 [Capsicum annuum]|nr:hypothetical protein FXO37_32248 [Capsicum annuum]KAF3667421.1 hypothetical protein FXO38_08606 [Capsicum annuum]